MVFSLRTMKSTQIVPTQLMMYEKLFVGGLWHKNFKLLGYYLLYQHDSLIRHLKPYIFFIKTILRPKIYSKVLLIILSKAM